MVPLCPNALPTVFCLNSLVLQPTNHTNFGLTFQDFLANSLPAFKIFKLSHLKKYLIIPQTHMCLSSNKSFFFFLPHVPCKIYNMIDIILFIIFKIFKLKDNCFTEFCGFLSYINKNQP